MIMYQISQLLLTQGIQIIHEFQLADAHHVHSRLNVMEQSDSAENVRKVYISDSPVNDDNIEYNYVNSDIEDELEPTHRDHQPALSEPMVADMPPQPDMSEVEELAKEAAYQRELQERLQKATLEDQPPVVAE